MRTLEAKAHAPCLAHLDCLQGHVAADVDAPFRIGRGQSRSQVEPLGDDEGEAVAGHGLGLEEEVGVAFGAFADVGRGGGVGLAEAVVQPGGDEGGDVGRLGGEMVADDHELGLDEHGARLRLRRPDEDPVLDAQTQACRVGADARFDRDQRHGALHPVVVGVELDFGEGEGVGRHAVRGAVVVSLHGKLEMGELELVERPRRVHGNTTPERLPGIADDAAKPLVWLACWAWWSHAVKGVNTGAEMAVEMPGEVAGESVEEPSAMGCVGLARTEGGPDRGAERCENRAVDDGQARDVLRQKIRCDKVQDFWRQACEVPLAVSWMARVCRPRPRERQLR